MVKDYFLQQSPLSQALLFHFRGGLRNHNGWMDTTKRTDPLKLPLKEYLV